VTDAGLALLAARVAALPETLAEAARVPLPALDALRGARRWVTTGVGGSEGPARVMAAALRESLGVCASFAPLSRFVSGALRLDDAALVVFSQGLSPNARVALARTDPRATLLVTAAEPAAAPGLVVAKHPPRAEDGLLVRVLGPAAATLTALRIVDALTDCSTDLAARVPSAADRALGCGAALDPALPVALLACDDGMDLAHGLRWAWLESLRCGDVSVWDALGFAHGPLQLSAARPTNVALLRRDDPRERALFARTEALLEGCGHRVLRLDASLPGPWAYFEHDAAWAASVVATLRVAPQELLCWPLQGRDGALYEIDAPL